MSAEYETKPKKGDENQDSEIIKGSVKLQIWDTAGEERFRAMTKMYYKDAKAIIITFSLTSLQSFDALDLWMKEIDKNIRTTNFQLVIVGTKSDIDDEKEVSVKDG